MDDKYVCPQCGAEYGAPGECETCQIPLTAPDEDDELEGFQTDDEVAEDEEDEELAEEDFAIESEESNAGESEEDTYVVDTYEDSENY
ncbi:hypothetical protein HY627_00020 [Candidatus Uhrbacteria bacterium]|nr:hypothetical protein [Candidatus Uhrbacteria bacterium]